MSRKSRRNRAKQAARSQRVSKAQPVPGRQPLAVGPPAMADVPSAVVSEAVPKVVAAGGIRYDYVIGELRRIGVLAGIMLVILVILVIILS